jgi:hypothetical protein
LKYLYCGSNVIGDLGYLGGIEEERKTGRTGEEERVNETGKEKVEREKTEDKGRPIINEPTQGIGEPPLLTEPTQGKGEPVIDVPQEDNDRPEIQALERKPVVAPMQLAILACGNNRLNYLSLDNCEQLEELQCWRNQIDYLNLRSNKILKTLDCSSNLLTRLDLSNNGLIQHLDCSSNKLEILDIGSSRDLKYLDCRFNQLINLDIFQNRNLNSLFCDSKVQDYAAMHEFVALNNLRSVVESKSTDSNSSIDGLKKELDSLNTAIYWIIGLIAFLIIAKIIKTISA